MALNYATNIMPSVSGSFSSGTGVVDVTEGITFSWQVNGTSPMIGYRLTIYENDNESAEVYDSGIVPLPEPFYGKDALGNYQLFSFTVPAEVLLSSGMVNGEEYKFSITQMWGYSEMHWLGKTQRNVAVFWTRKKPTIQINPIPDPVPYRSYTFTANYYQREGDYINWVRWQIANSDDIEHPIYDSKIIYTSLLSCTYDGFFSSPDGTENNYKIRCIVQTDSGVEADTGWVPFTVYYAISPLQGYVEAKCLHEMDAVEISWPNITSIPGTSSGNYQIYGGVLSLPAEESVTWNRINESALRFSTPFSVLWKTEIYAPETQTNLVEIQTDGGKLAFYADGSNSKLGITMNGQNICEQQDLPDAAKIVCILTPSKVYWRITYNENALQPSETLYPSEALYPSDGTSRTDRIVLDASYDQYEITSAKLIGNQLCDYFMIIRGEPTEATIGAAWETGTYIPEFEENTNMLADFSSGLNAGLATVFGREIDGYIVYRQRANEKIVKVGTVSIEKSKLYDFTLRNQQGPYKWSVYPKSGDSFAADAIESNEVNPCFWDWELFSCKKSEDGYFLVNSAFRFRYNVETSEISNNNEPAIYRNFTPYPTIMRSPQNYQSGTLTGLIGDVYYEDGKAEYKDSLERRSAIMRLSVTSDRLFLRNRKGEILEVSISGEITMDTMDNAASQAQTVKIPWAEVGDASDVSLIAFDLPSEEGD